MGPESLKRRELGSCGNGQVQGLGVDLLRLSCPPDTQVTILSPQNLRGWESDMAGNAVWELEATSGVLLSRPDGVEADSQGLVGNPHNFSATPALLHVRGSLAEPAMQG